MTTTPAAGAQVRALQEDPASAGVVEDAIAAFHAEHAGERLPPLVIVIAALDEEASIGAVLDEVPPVMAGLDTRVVVIDDGSSDRTSEVAAKHGALVCRLAVNCGHGAALRAGYRIAREHGAQFLATLDADGQWNSAHLPAMVELLKSGQADFVVGSRRLGATENTDVVRNLGVRFFSRVLSLITATRITDTSSGLRAMRVEITATVRQTQPQYQTSELLIGALLQGYHVVEVPTVMRKRSAGTSKKGHDLFYGVRYGQVIAKTTYREWPNRVPRRDRRRPAGTVLPGHPRILHSESSGESGVPPRG